MGFQHTIIFNSTITPQTVQEIIDEINQYEYVNFYFSTDGGNINEMIILIDFLNYRYNEGTLKLVLYDFVASAGTFLLFDYEGPIFIQRRYFRGFLFHAPDITLRTIRNDVLGKKSKELLETMNEDVYSKYIEIGLTKADITKIRNGEDVYLWYNDLGKIKRTLFESEETRIQIIQKQLN